MAVLLTVFAPGEIIRCIGINAKARPCLKPFGVAVQTVAVSMASKVPRGDLMHRCRACRTEMDVWLGAVQVGRVA